MKYSNAVERCFHRCNLLGEDADIWKEMMRYKALREANEALQEDAYISIAVRLGFISNEWYERIGEQKNG